MVVVVCISSSFSFLAAFLASISDRRLLASASASRIALARALLYASSASRAAPAAAFLASSSSACATLAAVRA